MRFVAFDTKRFILLAVMINTYAIIGTGAIGGYLGMTLAKAGREVHFLLHNDYEHVLENGLQLDSCFGNYHIDNPLVYDSTSRMPKVDVVIVALKTSMNHILPEILPPLLREDTLVLMTQNGVGVEEELHSHFPSQAIFGGVVYIASTKTGPGHIHHEEQNLLKIVNWSGTAEQMASLCADLNEAGIRCREFPYADARWGKAMWNMVFNGLTVVTGLSLPEIFHSDSMMEKSMAMIREVQRAGTACGATTLDEQFIKTMLDTTCRMTHTPSMKEDYDRHHPMEIEFLYTRPIREALAHGCSMPLISELEGQLLMLSKHEIE